MIDWLAEFFAYLVCIWVGAGAGFLIAALFMGSQN
jgi:hypothetical protein